ncbi:MAG: hypothetical protein V1800_00360 [Candidatus Latescibacterota bacterium]
MNDASAVSGFPERCVPDGVPRVGFFPDVKDHGGKPWPEDFIFPSCLRAILEYHGDTTNDYVRLMGVSGGAFFLNWGGWEGDNAALYYMSADLGALFSHTFQAIGYPSQAAPCGKPGEHAQAIREMVLWEINAGRPCLAHGVVGPPETSLITGYDEGGDVLIGWSFFQAEQGAKEILEFEPSGYFRKRNWEPETWDAMTVGPRESEPDRKETFRKALEWALTVVRTPRTFQDRPNGIAAFDAWIEHLGRDEEIAHWRAGDSSVHPFDAQRDATDGIAEGRWYASRFLVREAPECMPYQASHLYAAASCYAREHELVWEVWCHEGGMDRGAETMAQFLDPQVRRRSIALIEQARDLDAQAADHVEAALHAAQGTLGAPE